MKKTIQTKTSAFGSKGRINHDSSSFYQSKLYSNLEIKQNVQTFENPFPDKYLNTIIHGSSEKMEHLPDNCVHLMITSPPYNVGKEYDEDLSLNDYLELLRNVFSETYRVLVFGGRACVNIANVGRKPYIPLSDYVSKLMIEIGFLMRGEIIWNKGSSASSSTAWGSWQSAVNPTLRDVHEYILIFSKGDFKRIKHNKNDTITKEQFLEWTKSVWTFKAENASKVGHPAPFPVMLPYRLIQLYSFEGDIVIDPFMGSGSTAIAALQSGRKFVGYEIHSEYIEIANTRLKPYLLQQKLKF